MAIWESWFPNEGQDARAGDQWTVPEMWLSACVDAAGGSNAQRLRKLPDLKSRLLIETRDRRGKSQDAIIFVNGNIRFRIIPGYLP